MASLQRNEIAIKIGPLVLLADSDIMVNPAVQRIYIEYNFLNQNGSHSNETPQSLPKPVPPETSISFDFRKVFRIEDQGTNRRAYIRLVKLLKHHDRNIKFIVVSEPPKEDRNRKGSEHFECIEIALGLLHLGKIVAEAEPDTTTKSVQIPIMSKSHPYKNAGHLEILIEGVKFMKTLAAGSL